MQKKILDILIHLLVLSVVPGFAFDGFGGATVGGSAQTTVLTVTSLADSGAGTLREAFSTARSLTDQSTDCSSTGVLINFNVSGDINLLSGLTLRFAGCVTLDGEGQITIKDRSLVFRDSANIVVTNMRSRNAADDGFRFQNVDLGVITKSSSFGHGDGGIDIVDGTTSFTASDNIIHHDPTLNRTGMLLLQFSPTPESRVNNVTVARNIFSELNRRQPQVNTDGRVDVINNLVRNWGPPGTSAGSGTRLSGDSFGDATNNLYSKNVSHDNDALIINPPADYHISGNLSIGVDPDNVNLLSTQATSFGNTGINQIPAEDVICRVKDDAGARPLDPIDQALINAIAAECNQPEEDLVLLASQDAELDENSPRKNIPSSALLKPRSWDVVPGGPQDNHRAIVQFDVASLGSISIQNAVLEMCLVFINSPQIDVTINAHRLTESWLEADVTATERQSGEDWSTYFGSFNPTRSDSVTVNKDVDGRNPNAYYAWDVTDDVQDMINGSLHNNGWLIRHDIEGGGFIRTDWVSSEAGTNQCGSESGPRLVITE